MKLHSLSWKYRIWTICVKGARGREIGIIWTIFLDNLDRLKQQEKEEKEEIKKENARRQKKWYNNRSPEEIERNREKRRVGN